NFAQVMTIPVAALTGDNVVYHSTAMPWYAGPTLLDYLEAVDPVAELVDAPFRLPVQLVLRAAGDFRGYAGTVTSGRIKVGDRIVDARSGLGATLRRIASMDGDMPVASKGDAVTLVLDTDLDISRGAVLSETARRPVNADVIEARLVWLSETPFDPETLASTPAHACGVNDIADCRVLLGRATAIDLFRDLPGTGNFVLVSAIDGATVAGGVTTWPQAG